MTGNNNNEALDHGKAKSDAIDITDNEEINDSPIEQVRLTVPITDDPSLPALTFRTWFLGIISCALLAFVNQFFAYRTNQVYFGSLSAQILALPAGKFMAATLPKKSITVPFTGGWSFSLNPGPFNIKEHVLITIFANSGAGGNYAVHIINIVKAFYHRGIHIVAAFLLTQTTQMLGYGWAGLFRKYLVDSPYMWWPSNLIQVSLFGAFHEKETRPRGGLTRIQFFLLVFASSFAYYIVPGYLFPSISMVSVACLVWPKSVLAQQIGSGYKGLGIGSFGLDWATVAGFLGTPLAMPMFAITNILAGFVFFCYIVNPVMYWNNIYDAKKFPLISPHSFDSAGNRFNITRILNEKTFEIDLESYNNYSKLYLSTFFYMVYGLSFATLAATVSHVVLFHGQSIWDLSMKAAKGMSKGDGADVHTRLMKKNYDEVPQWWFIAILIPMVGLSIFACEGFGKQLQLPWWGVLLGCAMAIFFTLPVGVIQATTNMQTGLNVITELVIGYMLPGKPLANVSFKTYGYISMSQALTFVGDFKLGHYMKIPPKSMFIVQLVGTVIASVVYFSTAWWLLVSIPNICDPTNLPEGSPWTCPNDDVFYNASIIWGVVGPLRMFAKLGVYGAMNWFFLIGILAPFPVWILARAFPNKKWIPLINMPIFFSGPGGIPPAHAVNYWMWGAVGIYFNYYVYKKYKGWWARHTYILSAGLDAGLAFIAVLLYFALQSKEVYGPNWWGLDATDHCPLAACPTAPGVAAKNCPVVH